MARLDKLKFWIEDYFYMAGGHVRTFFYRKPPKHFLGHIVKEKDPIVIIPGIFEKWGMLKKIIDPLSRKGHPIYIVPELKYNAKNIHNSSGQVASLINKKNLKNVILLAHSKGGLIGKHMLAFHNKEERIKKLIAIATPFGGSEIAKKIPIKPLKELSPDSEIIKTLKEEKQINSYITCIMGEYDNHVWPTENCKLDGAKNIKISVDGHHKILFNRDVVNSIIEEVETS